MKPLIHKPTLKDFKLPETDEEMETLIKSMEAGGAMRIEAETNIKSRRAAFNKASREYEKEMRLSMAPGKTTRSRKTSLEKQK